jgi:tRNA threonylcarbamoyladenosine biosynthesis protein TsaE
MTSYTINSQATFDKALSDLSASLRAGDIVFLSGNLGAGKTHFVRSLLQKLGYNEPVKSPTFTLVESHELPAFTVYHFDLYRIEKADELDAIGFHEYFTKDSVVFIEWPEKAKGYLPKATIEITIEFVRDNSPPEEGWQA